MTKQTLIRSKDCKHSIRFDADPTSKAEPTAITSIYISRTVPNILAARKVEITIEPVN